ncbi:MAG: hypothetical protein ABI823_09455, partial [Bryobacteraceae bacterium]
IERLRVGGTYIVEDIESINLDRWKAKIEQAYSARYPAFWFALVIVPNPANSFDNNLLIARRRE